MEPMMLGNSPPGSSPGISQSHFLPNYLIGNDNVPLTSNKGISPSRNRSTYGSPNSANHTPLIRKEVKTLRQKLMEPAGTGPNESTPNFQMQSTSRCGVSICEKPGPPTASLFDTPSGIYNSILSSTSAGNFEESPSMVFNDASFSRIHRDDTYNMSDTTNIMIKPNVTAGRMKSIGTKWITVFGITPRILNLVISELSQCGAIIDRNIPAQGNWIHVKFSNFNEVSKALALNGKCIDNNMIGVQLCHNVCDDDKENASIHSPPLNVRSLRQAASGSGVSINYGSPNQQQLPQKSGGLITKALEYVFGW